MRCKKDIKAVRHCGVTVADHHFHPGNNPANAHACIVCKKEVPCKDIQSGTFTFVGPAVLIGTKNIHKSYLVSRIPDATNDSDSTGSMNCPDADQLANAIKAGAIFPGSRTCHFPDTASADFSLPGIYTVSFNWDACCEDKPCFEAVEYTPHFVVPVGGTCHAK